MSLRDLGWPDDWPRPEEWPGLEPGLVIGRVAKSFGYLGVAWTASEAWKYSVAGRLRIAQEGQVTGLPVTGDWVAMRPLDSGGEAARVEAILPRRTVFTRKVAGNAREKQAVAANMDVLFIVTSMNRDFNARRLERYLALARESGAEPVVVLNKMDVAEQNPADYLEAVRALDSSIPVYSVSSLTGGNMDVLESIPRPGRTIALLGSSGVGKSTIINRLLGEERLRTMETRGDDRGRHTTTTRELVRLPGGGLVIDTPGMRELQMPDQPGGLEDAFDDILELALKCRFADCCHATEPGCAVREAVASGLVSAERIEAFRKLRSELRAVSGTRGRASIRLDKKIPRSSRPVSAKHPKKK